MQAIKTKFLPCTDCTGARIKASCERGSITIPYPYEGSSEYGHVLAIESLLAKFNSEDIRGLGYPQGTMWWPNGYHIAQIDNTGYIAVPIFSFNKFGGGDNAK